MENIFENLNQEDKEFLHNLREEMLNQDHDYQAGPRFWVVGDVVERIVPEGYGDRIVIMDKESNYKYESIEDFRKMLIEEEYCTEAELEDVWDDELIEYIDNKESGRFVWMEIVEENMIQPNTFFLTKKECLKHIEENAHHYNKPFSYAMTAWRSPEVAKLWEIIEGGKGSW